MLRSKGVLDAVAAVRRLRAEGLAVELMLAGPTDPDNPDSLDDRALAALSAEPGVVWLGRIEDVREVWAEAAIAVLPSTYGEGLPKSLLEAAACGRAIIASDMPGCREIARPGGPRVGPGAETGLLVPPGDVAALAQAVAVLARGAERRRAMGRAGRLLVEREFAKNVSPPRPWPSTKAPFTKARRTQAAGTKAPWANGATGGDRVWLAVAGLAGVASMMAGAPAALGGDARAAELQRLGALYGMVHATALAVVRRWRGGASHGGAATAAGCCF